MKQFVSGGWGSTKPFKLAVKSRQEAITELGVITANKNSGTYFTGSWDWSGFAKGGDLSSHASETEACAVEITIKKGYAYGERAALQSRQTLLPHCQVIFQPTTQALSSVTDILDLTWKYVINIMETSKRKKKNQTKGTKQKKITRGLFCFFQYILKIDTFLLQGGNSTFNWNHKSLSFYS